MNSISLPPWTAPPPVTFPSTGWIHSTSRVRLAPSQSPMLERTKAAAHLNLNRLVDHGWCQWIVTQLRDDDAKPGRHGPGWYLTTRSQCHYTLVKL